MPFRIRISSQREFLFKFHARSGRIGEAEEAFDRVPQRNVAVWNMMIHACAQRDQLLEGSWEVFHRMPQHDTVSWNTMIAALSKAGNARDAIALFEGMFQRSDLSWNLVIQTFASTGNLPSAKLAFDLMPQCSTNAVLSVNAMSGHLEYARSLYETMPHKSAASWATMIEGYFLAKDFHQAWHLISLLPAKNLCLETVIISGHAKQGHLHESKLVFDSIPEKNVLSWNAVIAAFSHRGALLEAMNFFQEMLLEGVAPIETTFTALLHGCSHEGRIGQGQEIFSAMIRAHGITPLVDHYNCMVDVLGRLKRLEEAEELVRSMPVPPSSVTWTTLLSACRHHGDAERGSRVAEILLQLSSRRPLSG
ncbi:pentatricopeptide repeat-containing protein At3g29230-like [Selaginella moellendorffii]|uniref:pentatricopeptide repeat-containing protein At3g29230-like n=1 Tax=Selaginella moellendorffii TaxID=88036 RepID=UPI000D1C4F83|nr:pentatricopeptide repeat-containing protein At3g29230-like [Selaginella moellendorffii]|eukprot:XP_024545476.1 pentatricopeptide repeat-containing protein At3g29230-like [Selaginella moellendorffii]